MGIPQLFNFLRFNCKLIDINIKECPKIENLFLDLNVVVYQAVIDLNKLNEIKNNDEHYQCALFKQFFNIVSGVLNYVRPTKRIYFIFDGTSPRAKFQVQLSRRIDYLTKINYNENSKIKFTSCLLSPGTKFMEDLNNRLTLFIKSLLNNSQFNSTDIYYSSYLSPGEGEFKIFKFIKDANIFNERNMIFGKDTDFIIYGLANKIYDLKILTYSPNLLKNETTDDFKIDFKLNCLRNKGCDKIIFIDNKLKNLNFEDFEHIDVNKFYQYLMNIFNGIINLDKDNLIRDIILIFILLGTDYIITMPYFNRLSNPLNKLLCKYLNHLEKNNSAYLTKENGLRLDNFQIYINSLKKELFSKLNVNKGNIKSQFYKNEMNIKNGKPSKECLKQLTSDYLFGLYWNLKLYYLDILSWDFKMKKFPPFIDDLIFDNELDFNVIRNKSKPLLPLNFLLYITPFQSFNILPGIYRTNLKHIFNKPDFNHSFDQRIYHNLNLNISSRRDKKYNKINKIIEGLNCKLNEDDSLRNLVRPLSFCKVLDKEQKIVSC